MSEDGRSRHAGRGRGVPRSRSGVIGRRWERTGDEPVTARSALRVRLLLSGLFLPLYLAGTGLLWYWAAHSDAGSAPSSGSLWVLTAACGTLALLALADLVVVLLRRRRERSRG